MNKGNPKDSIARILVVDDEDVTLKLLAWMVEESALGLTELCADPRRAMGLMASTRFDAVILDLHMPWLSGRELLGEISSEHPDVPVIIMTSEDKLETAVACMKEGAFDFLTKPLDKNRLVPSLGHALALSDLRREVKVLASRSSTAPEPSNPEAFSSIITRSPRMRAIFSYIEAIAPSPRAVLITGESGTGKELIARAIHTVSGRPGSFTAINVSGLDDVVFSDSLFGHVRGAYTGAEGVRKGLVDQSRDGTLFLDEIGDLGMSSQIKLLRLLQEGEYYPLGSDIPQRSRARIITATNADLAAKQDDNSFRKDLYYRLISHQIQIPPLRDRKEDIPDLLAFFAKEAAQSMGREQQNLDSAVLEQLTHYDFPGNVRELQSMVFDAVSRSKGIQLHTGHFALKGTAIPELVSEPVQEKVPEEVPLPGSSAPFAPESTVVKGPGDFWLGAELPKMAELEDFLYELALSRTGGRQQAAAELVGVSQSTLSRWLKERKKYSKSTGSEV